MKRSLWALGLVLLLGSPAWATWPWCVPAAPAVGPMVVYQPAVAPLPPPRPVRYHYGPIKRVEGYWLPAVPVAAGVPSVSLLPVPFAAVSVPGSPCAQCATPEYPPSTFAP